MRGPTGAGRPAGYVGGSRHGERSYSGGWVRTATRNPSDSLDGLAVRRTLRAEGATISLEYSDATRGRRKLAGTEKGVGEDDDGDERRAIS